MRWTQLAVAFGVGIVLAVGTQCWSRSGGPEPRTEPTRSNPPLATSIAAERETAIVRAVRDVSPAVVSIAVRRPQTVGSGRGPFAPYLWDDVMSRLFPNAENQAWELGSGVVIDEVGHIVTNAHVLDSAVDIYIVLSDGRSFARDKIELLGLNQRFDLAVLKVQGEEVGLLAAPLGDPTQLVVGEWLIAIGNPYGFYLSDPRQPSVSVGVVSALDREVRAQTRAIYKNMIQTDAAINPGNSGGALANAAGEVVGINSFILTTDGGSVGLGFALPMDIVQNVVSDFVQYGRVQIPYAGLTQVENMTPRLGQSLGIPTKRGVIVLGLEVDSPAARAGLEPFDVIVSINKHPVADYAAADRAIFGLRIGDTIELGVERMGAPLTFRFPLEADPNLPPLEGSRS